MALGGGTWTSQNKTLPGSYINFTSATKASSALSSRGIVAMPLFLDWGPIGEVFTVTNEDFQKNSMEIFGYPYASEELLLLRELFANTKILHTYRLNAPDAVSATNTYATAKCPGTRGNAIKIAIAKTVDEPEKWQVSTYLDTVLVDQQTVKDTTELKSNDFVMFKSATLTATASTPLTGGTDGGTINGAIYQDFLDKVESYSYNALGCPTADPTITALFVAFTKRMRDEIGANFQSVVYKASDADYEGVISVENNIVNYNSGIKGMGVYGLVYWTTGVVAGCEVNKSNSNKKYNGALNVSKNYTQVELEDAIKAGKFIYHNVNGETRILADINTLVNTTETKSDSFKSNQTIRVCDQIANDTAVLFNNFYLGTVPNDPDGRVSLWNSICKIHQELASLRAIENFDPNSVTIEQGNTKKSVVCNVANLNIVNAMSQLYMSIVVE